MLDLLDDVKHALFMPLLRLVSTSVFVSANVSTNSPWKLFIFITKIHIIGSKYPKTTQFILKTKGWLVTTLSIMSWWGRTKVTFNVSALFVVRILARFHNGNLTIQISVSWHQARVWVSAFEAHRLKLTLCTQVYFATRYPGYRTLLYQTFYIKNCVCTPDIIGSGPVKTRFDESLIKRTVFVPPKASL